MVQQLQIGKSYRLSPNDPNNVTDCTWPEKLQKEITDVLLITPVMGIDAG